jgi:hypothetical protein
MFHEVKEGLVPPQFQPLLHGFPNPMDQRKVPKNCRLVAVLIECGAGHGFPALHQVTGATIVYLFPATTKDRIKSASIIAFKEIPEVMPGSIIFR